ncbi:hypothetical protein INR49_004042 [Caranx melampygus]|nr:hypothetical protein INR49_004042 [Caranx melampygus]
MLQPSLVQNNIKERSRRAVFTHQKFRLALISKKTSTTMKLLLAGLVLLLVAEANAQWYTFPFEAAQGARDMLRAYNDMKDANFKNSDKYFHARGNYDAAQRGAGGRWAAEVIRCNANLHLQLLQCSVFLPTPTVYNSLVAEIAIPGSGHRKEWVVVMRTQRLIRQQTAGDGMEMIPIISDQLDFLTNTDHNKSHQLLMKTSTTMKLLLAGLVLLLVAEANAQWYTFPFEAVQGARDMWRAYSDMRNANFTNSDKYFHARGNYDAAQRGAGGRWAAEVISDTREWVQERMGHGHEDSEADQAANRWGRGGNDPNHFRPFGLPDKY